MMARKSVFECDCGCGEGSEEANAYSWFTLSQEQRPRVVSDDDAKLLRALHFASLACLLSWTTRAVEALPGLQSTAAGLQPRSAIQTGKVVGLYV